MNPAQLDLADGWRRYWWLIPPVAAAIVVFAVVRLGVFAPAPPALASDQVTEVFALAPGGGIDVFTFAGDIRVVATDSRNATVTVVRHGAGRSAADAFQDLAALGLQMQQSGTTVRVRTAHQGSLEFEASRAEITIAAPADARIQAETLRGSITLVGMLGDIRARVSEGDIAVHLPRDRAFRLDGSGQLKSEFRLATDDRTGEYLVGVTDPALAAQALNLSAIGGNVFLRRR